MRALRKGEKVALKFNCSKCGEIIAAKFVKPGEATNCGKCRATNTVPVNAVEIPDEQADNDLKPMPKIHKPEPVPKINAQTITKNKPSFSKVLKFSCGGLVVGLVIGFLVPDEMFYLYGLDRWVVVLLGAVVFGVIGYIFGDFMRPEDIMRSDTNNTVQKNRYPALRVIIGYYRVLAGTVILFTVIICISLFFGGPEGYFLARLLGAIVTGLLGMALYVTLRAIAEGITVFLDIEENTGNIRLT